MTKILHWFRDDLRLKDNPALYEAAQQGGLTCIYILEEDIRPLGGASKWWLHHSLTKLQASLLQFGVQMIFKRGKASDILPTLIEQHNFTHIHWNRRYHKQGIAIDSHLKSTLKAEVKSFSGTLLCEPFDIKRYKVFTPYWRAVQAKGGFRSPLPLPSFQGNAAIASDELDDWRLIPHNPNWAKNFYLHWDIGEENAATKAQGFVDTGLTDYAALRNRPDKQGTSRLSPHLRFGEISPHQLIAMLDFHGREGVNRDKFLSEIGWREFSYHLLYHYPDCDYDPINPLFEKFTFLPQHDYLDAWRQGKTGYPIVDAGMRELWQTGYIHNRVRMVVASFLTKHLLQKWQEGEQWFWDCLLDADLANNPISWQWVAGCGADASPYFRIFSPVLQGKKFDPNGDYVRLFVPELERLPTKYIHEPWLAPASILDHAGVMLDGNYPRPIIEHDFARRRALGAYDRLFHVW